MFASMSTDIGSDLPLWAVQDDFKPGVATTTRFMGGWTRRLQSSTIWVSLCPRSLVGWGLVRIWVNEKLTCLGGSRYDAVRGFG